MALSRLVPCFALLIACSVEAAEPKRMNDLPPNPLPDVVLHQVSAEPAPTPLLVGDDAPEFSYLGPDGAWHDFKELFVRGPLLLVFGATDDELMELEENRGVFDDLGVTPVVVMDRRVGSAASVVRRLGLSSPVVTDPKCAIGDLYSSLDRTSRRHAPSFFVLDGQGRVRAVGRGSIPPATAMLLQSARGLGLALPESAWVLLNS